MEIRVHEGQLDCEDILLHVPLPIAEWHDNIVYTCSNVHFFRTAREVDRWCDRHAVPRGETLPLNRAWALAKVWYGNYLASDWRPMNARQANRLLARLGLHSAFWQLPDGE